MRFWDKSRYGLFALVLLLVFSIVASGISYAFERELKFEILEKGDCSGYVEEAYIVLKNEADWVSVWERHTSIREPKEQPPQIDFSSSLVVCAFMGQRPTTGYSIGIERIWTDGTHVFVEVIKRDPSEGSVVCPVVTCPYIMVLMERTDMPFVFHLVNENERTVEYTLPEFHLAFFVVIYLVCICEIVVLLRLRKRT